jgi:hypothetical protein
VSPSGRGAARSWTSRAVRRLLVVSAVCCFPCSLPFAQEEGFAARVGRAIAASQIHGHLRLYDYGRLNDEGTAADNNALAVGGDILLDTGSVAGFAAGLGFYTANNIPTGLAVNEVLVGPQHHLHALAEAFLQYRRGSFSIRGGRQLIDTPWARQDMFTMLPRAFSGFAASIDPLPLLGVVPPKGAGAARRSGHRVNPSGAEHLHPAGAAEHRPHLSLFAARMFRYESRFDDRFTSGNRYTTSPTNGFVTVGARYHQTISKGQVRAEAWYYDFYDFARLGYLEARYTAPGPSSVTPLVAGQLVSESGSGADRLGAVHARIYGALVGLAFAGGHVTLVGNYSPERFGTFRHGGLVHPYNDLSGTLFTDTMNNGIADVGPGYAYGVKTAYGVSRNLTLSAAVVRYRVRYGFGGAAYPVDGPYGFPRGEPVRNQEQWAVDAGVVYHFTGALEALTIEDHVGVRDFEGSPHGAFIDNRLACIYAFSF